ncbi:MAG: hypothetical protein P1U54_09070 [Immundisolibacteraceae bacterium]|nr:hypothetical protein [Immundisolibacteraceae bacterium]
MSRHTLWQLIASDIQAYKSHASAFLPRKAGLLRTISVLMTPPLICSGGYRLAHHCFRRGHVRMAWVLTLINQYLTGATLHPESAIGQGLYVPHPYGVIFHGRAGKGLSLLAGAIVTPHVEKPVLEGTSLESAPQLADGVAVGASAMVAGAVSVGDSALIAAQAIADRNIPENGRVYPPRPMISR